VESAQALSGGRLAPRSRRVPNRKHASVLVMPQHAQRGHVQQQPGRGGDVDAHPGNGHGAEDVAVRECQHAPVPGGCEGDEIERSLVYLCGCLAAGATVFVELPILARCMDLLRGDAFVIAVVNLAQEWREMRVGKAGDLGRMRCASQWARVHDVEFEACEPSPERCRFLFTVGREGQIGVPGVTAVERPLCLAVAGEVDLERQAGLPIISGRPERSDRLALSMTAPALTRWPGRMHTSPTAA
jgi:hypothetical protein